MNKEENSFRKGETSKENGKGHSLSSNDGKKLLDALRAYLISILYFD